MAIKCKGEELINQGFRLPSDLIARIKESASRDRRSINGQAIVLLESALDMWKQKTIPPDEASR